jgi:hypothetical protein
LFENYFGLIEALLVFGLAIAFYLWQRHDLKNAREKTRAREERRKAQHDSDDDPSVSDR